MHTINKRQGGCIVIDGQPFQAGELKVKYSSNGITVKERDNNTNIILEAAFSEIIDPATMAAFASMEALRTFGNTNFFDNAADDALSAAKSYTDDKFATATLKEFNAVPTTNPATEYLGLTVANVTGGPGTYANFLSAPGVPIVFDATADQMSVKNWQLRLVGAYWQKYEVRLGNTYSKPETDATFLKQTGFTDALNSEVTRTPAMVTKSFGDALTGGIATGASLLTGRYHFNMPLGICDKNGFIKTITVNCTATGYALVAVGVSNIGGFTVSASSPVFVLSPGSNVIDLSSYNIPIAKNQVVALCGSGPSPASIAYYTSAGDPTWHFYYQAAVGSLITGATASYWGFKYEITYSDKSELFNTFAKPSDITAAVSTVNTRIDTFVQKVPLTLSLTAFPNAGATATGNVINVPIGQTGQYSYIRTIFSSILQYYFVGKTIAVEFIVKATPNLLLANMNAGANGVGAFGATKSLILNDGTYNYYNCAISIPVNSAITVIQPYVQTGNPTALVAAGSFEILNAAVSIVTSAGISASSVQSQMVDIKIAYAVAEAVANIRVGLQPKVITVLKNGTVGADCDFAGNRALQDALESIVDAGPAKPYLIRGNGRFEAKVAADYNSEGITTGMVSFVRLKNYVSIEGFGPGGIVLYGELPDNLTTTVYQYYQTVYGNNCNQCTIENVTIIGKNLRYPLHIDGGATGCTNFYTKFRNCRIEHLGNFNNALTGWTSMTSFGYGASSGQLIELENCTSISPFAASYLHNNTPYSRPTTIRWKNGKIVNNGNSRVIYAQSLGSGTADIMEYIGCSFEGDQCVINDSPWIPVDMNRQEATDRRVRIIGHGNSPVVVYNSIRGFALKIVSNGTGSITSVRFDTASAAYSLILKDKDYDSAVLPSMSDLGETVQGGYGFRDGNATIKGYAVGRLDIGGEGYGLNSNVYGKSLGKRLGDCSTVNISLGITIDGTTYTVTFNKNYSGGTTSAQPSTYTNAQIIAEIQAAIGSAGTVSEFSAGAEYYPEFDDYMQKAKATEDILKGMAVSKTANGSGIRKALSTDKKIFGVALDDIPTGCRGRIQVKGFILTGDTNRFNVIQDAYTAVVQGDELGISATPGKLSKTATIKHFYAFTDGKVSFNM